MDMTTWLNRATALIRFGPDRVAVRQELKMHLEDRRDALLARGLSEKEAEEAAAAAMGDPTDLSWELGKLHAPLWGYIWRATQVLVGITLACTLVFCLVNWGFLGLPEQPQPRRVPASGGSYIVQYVENGPVLEVQVPHAWTPEGSVSLGGYRFTAPAVWIAHRRYEWGDEPPRDVYHLIVRLQASTWRFWEPLNRRQDMILNNAAVDDQGTAYAYHREDAQEIFCYAGSGGPGITWIQVELALTGPDDIPAWVDIPIGYGGHSLRINLEREVLTT